MVKSLLLLLFFSSISIAQSNTDHFNKGITQFQNKEFEAAEISFTKSITNNNNNNNNNNKVAYSYLIRGQIKGRLKRHEEAVLDFTKSLELDNVNEVYLRFIRGVTYNETNKYGKALSDFDRVIHLDPNYNNVYFWRGKTKTLMHADMSKYLPSENITITNKVDGEDKSVLLITSAINDFNLSIAKTPNYGESYKYRGLSFGLIENYDMACQDLNKAFKLGEEISEDLLKTTCDKVNSKK